MSFIDAINNDPDMKWKVVPSPTHPGTGVLDIPASATSHSQHTRLPIPTLDQEKALMSRKWLQLPTSFDEYLAWGDASDGPSVSIRIARELGDDLEGEDAAGNSERAIHTVLAALTGQEVQRVKFDLRSVANQARYVYDQSPLFNPTAVANPTLTSESAIPHQELFTNISAGLAELGVIIPQQEISQYQPVELGMMALLASGSEQQFGVDPQTSVLTITEKSGRFLPPSLVYRHVGLGMNVLTAAAIRLKYLDMVIPETNQRELIQAKPRQDIRDAKLAALKDHSLVKSLEAYSNSLLPKSELSSYDTAVDKNLGKDVGIWTAEQHLVDSFAGILKARERSQQNEPIRRQAILAANNKLTDLRSHAVSLTSEINNSQKNLAWLDKQTQLRKLDTQISALAQGLAENQASTYNPQKAMLDLVSQYLTRTQSFGSMEKVKALLSGDLSLAKMDENAIFIEAELQRICPNFTEDIILACAGKFPSEARALKHSLETRSLELSSYLQAAAIDARLLKDVPPKLVRQVTIRTLITSIQG